MMKSPANEKGRFANEGPQHRVTFDQAFAVGKFTVTFDEWDACVADGGCSRYRPSNQGGGRGLRPVINVSWDDAKAYVTWLSRKTGKTYRLLSEAEYEYAARAGTTTSYPWGNAVGKNNANCAGCGSRWDNKQTALVGSFAPNRFGLYDMVGNVWTWAEGCYHGNYQRAATDGAAWRTADCGRRVVRGGGWGNSPVALRSAVRDGHGTGTTGESRHQCSRKQLTQIHNDRARWHTGELLYCHQAVIDRSRLARDPAQAIEKLERVAAVVVRRLIGGLTRLLDVICVVRIWRRADLVEECFELARHHRPPIFSSAAARIALINTTSL